MPLFLIALALARGLPALLYRRELGDRQAVVAGLLQATSLPFIVAATQIGVEIGAIDDATAAALVGAGIASVLLFPAAALTLLGRAPEPDYAGSVTSGASTGASSEARGSH